MKKRIFTLMIALAAIGVMKAQARYGEDVLIKEYGSEVKTQISVADKGNIYVLASIENEFDFWVSYDEGATYQLLKHYFGSPMYDMDMVVSGEDAGDIKIWFAIAYKNDEGHTLFFIMNLDAQGIEHQAKAINLGNVDVTSVAIATDYRSPGSDGSPFAIAVACAYHEYDDDELYIDRIGYFYSLDGGTSFSDNKVVYRKGDVEENEWVNGIDLSLGCQKGFTPQGRAGIVATTHVGEDVMFFLDRYDFGLTASGPIQPIRLVGDYGSSDYAHPTFQMMNDNAKQTSQYFFLIAAECYDQGYPGVEFFYPKEGFHEGVANPESYFDWYGEFDIAGPDMAYDKTNHCFLLTYKEWFRNKLRYAMRNYGNISQDLSTWYYPAGGEYANTDDLGSESVFVQPRVDINPAKTKACFTWALCDQMSNTWYVYADTEWATEGMEECPMVANSLSLAPNPTHDKTVVKVEEIGSYIGSVYDMQGRKVMGFSFSGTEHDLELSGLPAGVYTVHLQSDAAKHVSKMVVE